jgi:hypothetical protein
LLRKPADDIALLLYRRSPAKMFALMRSVEELAATGWAVSAARTAVERRGERRSTGLSFPRLIGLAQRLVLF